MGLFYTAPEPTRGTNCYSILVITLQFWARQLGIAACIFLQHAMPRFPNFTFTFQSIECSNMQCTFTTTANTDAPCGLGQERCRISPPRFLAKCCKRQLNQCSFVLLYFRLFTSSDLYWVWLSVFSCTVLFVSISQVIGGEDRLRNDLYCVEWGVKLYSNQPANTDLWLPLSNVNLLPS